MGAADIHNEIPINSSTNFRLASVTKQFTAASVLLLAEKHLLNTDDLIRNYFSELPDEYNAVRVSHLLSHSSGIWDYEVLLNDKLKFPMSDNTVLKLLSKKNELYFSPGSKFRYSNSGYALHSLIVGKVSGLRYSEFLEINVFKTLKMKNSVAFVEGKDSIKERAFGYSKNPVGDYKLNDQSATSTVLGDGGIYSSINDLYLWDEIWSNERLLSNKSIDLMFTETEIPKGVRTGYGIGWRIEKYKDHKVIYHTGSTAGFKNIYYKIPKFNISIILLTNRSEGDLKQKVYEILELIPDYL